MNSLIYPFNKNLLSVSRKMNEKVPVAKELTFWRSKERTKHKQKSCFKVVSEMIDEVL